MKILLLGGTGAMGVPLAESLAHTGHEVFVTSRQRRASGIPNIFYIKGNARDDSFLFDCLKGGSYDAIVDFMHYHVCAFEKRLPLLLDATNHYFFLSSCRVFAPCDRPITESSDRLLDVSTDEDFLKTEEYALSKAKCENLLSQSQSRNWSIIRPYITYNNERFQLSMYEKDVWLRRALSGKSIVFSKEMAEKKTTLTSGADVARVMAYMIQNRAGLGDAINVVGNDSVTWRECLDIYLDVIESKTGKRPGVVWTQKTAQLGKCIGNVYKLRYDRLSDRVFDNSKVVGLCNGLIEFEPIKEGLERCLNYFLDSKRVFKNTSPVLEAFLDKCSGEYTGLSSFPTLKQKFKYLIVRYSPCTTCFYPRRNYW